jgi:hypothetical protein
MIRPEFMREEFCGGLGLGTDWSSRRDWLTIRNEKILVSALINSHDSVSPNWRRLMVDPRSMAGRFQIAGIPILHLFKAGRSKKRISAKMKDCSI